MGMAAPLLGRAERSSPKARRVATGHLAARGLCVGHVLPLGGASPLCNLMEVKH